MRVKDVIVDPRQQSCRASLACIVSEQESLKCTLSLLGTCYVTNTGTSEAQE